MKKLIRSTIALGLLVLTSCVASINYLMVSVQEEGGIKFTQMTKDDDVVLGPFVTKTAGKIYWYAPPLIAVSPDGSKLAYLGHKNASDNIYIKNTQGGGAVLQRTFRTKILDMCFAPDGSKIAFTEQVDGSDNIYMINADEGSAIQQVTSTPSDEMGPQFSPDGKNIFFTKSEKTLVNNVAYTRYYVWGFNLQTSLFTQYSEGFTPSVTPDGHNIIVTRNNKNTNLGEIWMIDIEKGRETQLLSDKIRGFSSPKISPDGKRIICVGTTNATKNTPTNLDLYLFNINGTNLTQLTFHPGNDVSPTWAPDSKSIYFLSQRGTERGNWNVWQMNIPQ